jgi:alkylhydroperoxidase family enzyme
VWGAIRDLESSRLSEAEKALFRFVHKLNRDNANVSQQDVDTLLAAGWSEEAVYDAVSVCALFNFYNRWIDGTGVPDMPPEHYRQNAKRMATQGYARD